jgi:hypothetical protein
MASMPPINRYRIANWIKKNKTQPYVANKRLISLKKKKTGLQSKGRKRFSEHDPINRQK